MPNARTLEHWRTSHQWHPPPGGTVWYSRPWEGLHVPGDPHGLEYQTVPPRPFWKARLGWVWSIRTTSRGGRRPGGGPPGNSGDSAKGIASGVNDAAYADTDKTKTTVKEEAKAAIRRIASSHVRPRLPAFENPQIDCIRESQCRRKI